MHDFQRVVARAHRDVYARQKGGDDDDDDNIQIGRTTSTTNTRATVTSTSAPASTTSSAATTPSTTAKAPTTIASTSSTQAPLIDLSSILGFTSAIPIGKTTSSSSSSLPTTTPSSSSTMPPATSASSSASRQLSTSTATLTSSNSAAAASATESSTAHSGLSGAETGGIVAGSIFAGLALLIFAIRKTFMQRRKRKRNTWGAGIYPDINDKYADGGMDLPPPIPEKAPSPSPPTNGGYMEPRTPVWAPPRPLSPNAPAAPPMQSFYVQPPQPPQPSYNNAMMDVVPAVAPMAPAPASSFGVQSIPGEPATVKVLYIPTLPDELSIATGETVYIIKAYDDGWALCSNARGEQGVVPLECLDRNGQSLEANRLSVVTGQQESGGNGNGNSDWRNMKRMSSLSAQ